MKDTMKTKEARFISIRPWKGGWAVRVEGTSKTCHDEPWDEIGGAI